jgi:indolepyruvate ferredoxin oxidoreductase, beta subunit
LEIALGQRPAPGQPAPPQRATELHEVMRLGLKRLRDYQGERYAKLYESRMHPFLNGDPRLAAEVARHLALWMAYEDIIRVADLKTRASRFERVRREVGAKPGEPVVVIDYLKPGIEEFASVLPPFLGRRLVDWAQRRGKLDAYNIGMHIKTSGMLGYLVVRSLAWLRPWRPLSYRYREEQALIERWLALVSEAAKRDAALALEVAQCARLIKGYGETQRRGKGNFLAIIDALVENPPTQDAREQAAAIRKAREAALADPEGKHLGQALGKPVVWLKQVART